MISTFITILGLTMLGAGVGVVFWVGPMFSASSKPTQPEAVKSSSQAVPESVQPEPVVVKRPSDTGSSSSELERISDSSSDEETEDASSFNPFSSDAIDEEEEAIHELLSGDHKPFNAFDITEPAFRKAFFAISENFDRPSMYDSASFDSIMAFMSDKTLEALVLCVNMIENPELASPAMVLGAVLKVMMDQQHLFIAQDYDFFEMHFKSELVIAREVSWAAAEINNPSSPFFNSEQMLDEYEHEETRRMIEASQLERSAVAFEADLNAVIETFQADQNAAVEALQAEQRSAAIIDSTLQNTAVNESARVAVDYDEAMFRRDRDAIRTLFGEQAAENYANRHEIFVKLKNRPHPDSVAFEEWKSVTLPQARQYARDLFIAAIKAINSKGLDS